MILRSYRFIRENVIVCSTIRKAAYVNMIQHVFMTANFVSHPMNIDGVEYKVLGRNGRMKLKGS
jgi:hypothetical protein